MPTTTIIVIKDNSPQAADTYNNKSLVSTLLEELSGLMSFSSFGICVVLSAAAMSLVIGLGLTFASSVTLLSVVAAISVMVVSDVVRTLLVDFGGTVVSDFLIVVISSFTVVGFMVVCGCVVGLMVVCCCVVGFTVVCGRVVNLMVVCG